MCIFNTQYEAMKKCFLLLLFTALFGSLSAQMDFEGETLFGNEWINYSKSYAKINVDQDGIYRITPAQLESIGFPINAAKGRELVLYHYGKEVPLFVSTSGNFAPNDYIEFEGQRNDGRLDKVLFEDWENDMLNPYYSNYSDENSYYLAWFDDTDDHLRIETITNDLGGNLPQAEAFYAHEELFVYSEDHQSPSYPENIRLSHYFTGEGFGSDLENEHRVVFQPNDVHNAGFAPYIETRLGTYLGGHTTQLFVNGNMILQDNVSNFSAKTYTLTLTNAIVQGEVELEVKGVQSNSDRSSMAFAKLVYPRKFVFGNVDNTSFNIEGSSSNRYFELSGVNEANNVFLFDTRNGIRMKVNQSNGVTNFAIPANFQASTVRIYSASLNPASIELWEPSNEFTQNGVNYIILTHSELNSNASGTNQIAEYANYRRSELGGSFNVKVFEADKLYNEFSYGVEGHAQAINNFANYVNQTWPDIQYIFIIGKGLEYNLVRQGNEIRSYVPAFGIPGSDHLLLAEREHLYPVAAAGRIAIQEPNEIRAYLDKIKQHENPDIFPQSIDGVAWKKQMIHLAGGKLTDQESIFSGLEEMREIIENNKYGGKVTTYRKTASNDLENTVSQQIIDKINDGVSILTFFGHSAVGTFDFSIEEPEKYDNVAKYPFMLSMGCLAGNIHTPSVGVSEKFVLADQRGAIGFLAASGVATIVDQKFFGLDLYEKAGEDFYGQSLGEMIRAYIAQKEPTIGFNVNALTLVQQLTLHGDPAIVLLNYEGPDYTVDLTSIKTIPETVSSTLDSFEISFDIVNLGLGENRGLFYEIVHSFGGEMDTIIGSTITPENRKTIVEKIANKGLKSLGKNLIDIRVDPDNNIDEFPMPTAENNNAVSEAYNNEGYCFFIYDNTPTPIYPQEFSIVNKSDFTYLASAGNAFLEAQDYIMELDTTELFNSPLKVSANTNAFGGHISFDVDFNYSNNTVYYWRIKNASSEEEPWINSSFIYLPNESTGWNQSHYYQYLKDDFNTLTIDSTSRELQMGQTLGEYRIINTARLSSEVKPQFFYNNQFYGANDERNNGTGKDISAGVYAIVVDPISTKAWKNTISTTGPLYGSDIGIWDVDRNYFSFSSHNEEARAEITNFLTNVVPDGHFVILMTIQSDEHTYAPHKWPDDAIPLNNVLAQEGAAMMNDVVSQGPLPYVFAYVKGPDPTVLNESLSLDPFEELSVLVYTTGISGSGSICSPLIGPAQKWETVKWDFSGFNNSEDQFDYDIVGVRPNGNLDTLFNDIVDAEFDLTSLDPQQYPYIKLQLNSLDTTSFTTPDLDYWRVLYDELPEAVLNPNIDFNFVADTIFRGNNLQLSIRAENITQTDMDSLLVHFTVVDPANNNTFESTRVAPLLGEDFVTIDFQYPTSDLNNGVHELRMEINPDNDQREQYSFNNLAFRKFLIKSDDLNPLLNVTFDGVKIMNRDIVSPEPVISVNLTDDNTFALLTDKYDFIVALEHPDGTIEDVDVDGPNVTFIPADGNGKNRARLEYRPTLTDGIYTLKANAKDQNGNFSGSYPYEVEFEVITESSISNMLNYPNPFSTSTQFIFTLTGKEVPDDFVIRIMTVSGKVVKQITMDEFGPLHAGVNRSNYRWDGTDEFGNKLANGVYIYKVFLSDQNNSFDQRHIEGIDSFFKKGFGKMVILR